MEEVAEELLVLAQDCSDVCLYDAARLAGDFAAAYCRAKHVDLATVTTAPFDGDLAGELHVFRRGQSHFHQGEYLQTQHFLRQTRSRKAIFLRHYAAYMDIERENDDVGTYDGAGKKKLHGLAGEIASGAKDAFTWWLLGVTYRRLGLKRQAVEAYVTAVRLRPAFSSPWFGLVELANEIDANTLPNSHWMRRVYDARVAGERQDQVAAELYAGLLKEYPGCEYLMLQAALYSYHTRDYDTAQHLYEEARRSNPYIIEGMDTYSNILYVKGLKAELSHLAHSLTAIDKYRAETCSVIGNHYSIKAQHHQAVAYFQRALKINRRYLAAWTLLGHEYLELKNTPGAIEAYRTAIDIDDGDHRAWYGLGQAYELLGMYSYAVYYYSKACALRQSDGRMWSALGNTYKQLGQMRDAIQCYQRAVEDPHSDGAGLYELGVLYSGVGEADRAAHFYARYIARCHAEADEDAQSIAASLYLARYYKDTRRLAEAEALATRVIRYAGKDKEDAKQLLSEIRRQANL